ncbi:Rieske (2Fe-2S) protein [Nocardioides guangzhouensis]|uniref:Cytochrome bc1 complex Rieske iron-sulfur subunit n=1 Tax=Nocardioides guangzhouensis TaxID=2497878 RepID=A0A4Q4ZH57_9ACTN|nr:Rieske (2Fe-2S) protein [Nocardioides guangzhouensis]RYP87557.1 Rieske (2Fe-2S) protein [Nocardioides guangzhouensis]
MTDETTFSRRSVLGGTAALGVGVPLLAACGSEDSGGAEAKAPTSGTVLTTTSEVPVGGGVILAKEGLVVTQPEQGTFKAFSSKCTHQGCEVTKVTDGSIDCPCHGSKFSISDGSVQAGPAPSALPETKVTVDGQDVTTA